MNCTNCGAKIRGTRFCESCGAPAPTATVEAPVAPTASGTRPPPPPPPPPSSVQPGIPAFEPLTRLFGTPEQLRILRIVFLAALFLADFGPIIIQAASAQINSALIDAGDSIACVFGIVMVLIAAAAGVVLALVVAPARNSRLLSVGLAGTYGLLGLILTIVMGITFRDYTADFGGLFTAGGFYSPSGSAGPTYMLLPSIAIFFSLAVGSGFKPVAYFGAGIGFVLYLIRNTIVGAIFGLPVWIAAPLSLVFAGAALFGTIALTRVLQKNALIPRPPKPVYTSQYGQQSPYPNQAYGQAAPGYSAHAPTQAYPGPPYGAQPYASQPYGAQPYGAQPYGFQPGAAGPAQYQQAPGYYGQPSYNPHTNSFAIVSFIFGLLGGGLLPIIFGHVAMSQIRRTGEAGSGFATAGLVLGYLWAVIGLILIFVYLGAIRSIYG